jgi:hypothetical protein
MSALDVPETWTIPAITTSIMTTRFNIIISKLNVVSYKIFILPLNNVKLMAIKNWYIFRTENPHVCSSILPPPRTAPKSGQIPQSPKGLTVLGFSWVDCLYTSLKVS